MRIIDIREIEEEYFLVERLRHEGCCDEYIKRLGFLSLDRSDEETKKIMKEGKKKIEEAINEIYGTREEYQKSLMSHNIDKSLSPL